MPLTSKEIGELKKIDAMTKSDRIAAAKEKTQRVVDHVLQHIQVHETNAVVVYSNVLSSQIPKSYAANAFRVFQSTLHRFEIVRACALWDGIDLHKENLPTIGALIEPADIMNELVNDIANQWSGPDAEFGKEMGEQARNALTNAINAINEVRDSSQLASVMNLRHKRLAHSLSSTSAERAGSTLSPMKMGDEKYLLDKAVAVTEAFHSGVNKTGLDFAKCHQIGKMYAESLWHSCKFEIAE